MIKARYHWLIARLFDRYIDYIIRKDFHSISVEGTWRPASMGSLVIGNHVSWWDGFFVIYLNNRLLKKRFHVMMLEEQLSSRPFFSKVGAFSIKPGTRGAIESLNYASELLKNQGNVVLIYPQGKLHSIYNPDFEFENGVERIVNQVHECQILFYAAYIDYFSNRKPSLFFYLKEVEMKEPLLREKLQGLYQSFYDESLTHHSQLKV